MRARGSCNASPAPQSARSGMTVEVDVMEGRGDSASLARASVTGPAWGRYQGIRIMSVAKIIEISSASTKSFEDAVQNGISRAAETIKHIQGAWVAEQKVLVEKGKVVEYRVTLRLTFLLESEKAEKVEKAEKPAKAEKSGKAAKSGKAGKQKS
jgi:flavin-binding protein dodecin